MPQRQYVLTLTERQYEIIQSAVEFVTALEQGNFRFLSWMAINWGFSPADRKVAESYEQSLGTLFSFKKRSLRDQLLGEAGHVRLKQLIQLNVILAYRAQPTENNKAKTKLRQACTHSPQPIDGDPAPSIFTTTILGQEAVSQQNHQDGETSSDD